MNPNAFYIRVVFPHVLIHHMDVMSNCLNWQMSYLNGPRGMNSSLGKTLLLSSAKHCSEFQYNTPPF